MRLKRPSPDSEIEYLVLSQRERATLERAAVVAQDLEHIGYPGAGAMLAWLRGVLEDGTP